MRAALLVYIDEQKMIGTVTTKQRNEAHAFIDNLPSDVDRISEVAAMYADKCGEFDDEGKSDATGPTDDELADKAFEDGEQKEIF